MKLYDIDWDSGELRTFEVIGATTFTYLIKSPDGRQIVVAKDMYHKTPNEAWRQYSQDLSNAIEAQEKTATEVAKNIKELTKKIFDNKNLRAHVDAWHLSGYQKE